MHSWGSAKSLNTSVCQHRRHTRLDNLRTLILADNELDRLVLTFDEDDFEEEDSKSSESFEAIDATGKVGKSKEVSVLHFTSNFIVFHLTNKVFQLNCLISSKILLSLTEVIMLLLCRLSLQTGLNVVTV